MSTLTRNAGQRPWSRLLTAMLTAALTWAIAPALATAADATAAKEPPAKAQPAKAKPVKKAKTKAAKPTPPAPVPAEDTSTPITAVSELNATLGKSAVINLERPVGRLSVGNPAVADVILLNPKQLYVLGKTVGSTNLMLWDKQGRTAAVIDLNVSRELGALNSEIQKLVPGGGLRVRSMGTSIVIEGHAPDALTASKASDLAEAFLGKKAVNMISVDGVQQVMLEVKIAEINRTLVDSLGAKLGFSHPSTGGGLGWTLVGDLLSNSTNVDLPSVAPALQGGTNGFANPSVATTVPAGSNLSLSKPGATNRLLTLDALKQDGLVKILAEPNIVAMSGQQGGFLAGGQIFIPVPQGFGSVALQSENFGVGLTFTPTVLEAGRINLKVAPEVTDVQGFNQVAPNVVVPTLTTRRASTTVELRDGQTLAIGGLLDNRGTEAINRLPFLGEIPILGALFRSSQYQTNKTELVIVVTPHLVKAMAGTPPLPTDAFKEPSRSEFFLQGHMEGSGDNAPAAQTAPATPATSAPPADGHQLK